MRIQIRDPIRVLRSRFRNICPSKFICICIFRPLFTAENAGINQAFIIKSSVSISICNFFILNALNASLITLVFPNFIFDFFFFRTVLPFLSLFFPVKLKGLILKGMKNIHPLIRNQSSEESILAFTTPGSISSYLFRSVLTERMIGPSNTHSKKRINNMRSIYQNMV